MLQGIMEALATFQRLLERVMGDMHLLQDTVYMDDTIVCGRIFEEHVEDLS